MAKYAIIPPTFNMDTINKLYQEIKENIDISTTNFVLQGGYFEVNEGFNDFARNTLIASILLGHSIQQASRENTPKYTVLINDLGQVCHRNHCEILSPSPGLISKEINTLQDIGESYGINLRNLLLVRESTMRNRGMRKLRKIIKENSINNFLNIPLYIEDLQPEGLGYYYLSNYYEKTLVALIKNGLYVAKCPLIMGNFYSDMIANSEGNNLKGIRKNITIIDFCPYADKDKVIRGAEVGLNLLSRQEELLERHVILVFCDSSCQNIVIRKISAFA